MRERHCDHPTYGTSIYTRIKLIRCMCTSRCEYSNTDSISPKQPLILRGEVPSPHHLHLALSAAPAQLWSAPPATQRRVQSSIRCTREFHHTERARIVGCSLGAAHGVTHHSNSSIGAVKVVHHIPDGPSSQCSHETHNDAPQNILSPHPQSPRCYSSTGLRTIPVFPAVRAPVIANEASPR